MKKSTFWWEAKGGVLCLESDFFLKRKIVGLT
jgi:hypothetical protein